MTIETPAPSPEAEGSALPLARAFGDINTLTIPAQCQSELAGRTGFGGTGSGAMGAETTLRVSIVLAERGSITFTL